MNALKSSTATAAAIPAAISGMPNASPLVDTAAAAQFLQMSESWLEKDRGKKSPELPFVRMGRRTVRYRASDLIDYAAKQLRGLAA